MSNHYLLIISAACPVVQCPDGLKLTLRQETPINHGMRIVQMREEIAQTVKLDKQMQEHLANHTIDELTNTIMALTIKNLYQRTREELCPS